MRLLLLLLLGIMAPTDAQAKLALVGRATVTDGDTMKSAASEFVSPASMLRNLFIYAETQSVSAIAVALPLPGFSTIS